MALILCPRCRHLLRQEDPQRQPCTNCRGVYVRREAMAPLLDQLHQAPGGVVVLAPYRSAPGAEQARVAPPRDPGPRYLACPHCSKQMNRVTLFAELHIVVDMCINHGVWFDAEELTAAADYLRARTPGALQEDAEPEQQVELLLAHFFSQRPVE